MRSRFFTILAAVLLVLGIGCLAVGGMLSFFGFDNFNAIPGATLRSAHALLVVGVLLVIVLMGWRAASGVLPLQPGIRLCCGRHMGAADRCPKCGLLPSQKTPPEDFVLKVHDKY